MINFFPRISLIPFPKYLQHIQDENEDFALDENGNKIDFSVIHLNEPIEHMYNKEEILIRKTVIWR